MSTPSLYLELEYQAADLHRLLATWQTVIERHPILQSYYNEQQRLTLVNSNDYEIKLYDLSLQPAEKIRQVEHKLRQTSLASPLSETQWPWFSIKAAQYASGTVRFYLSFAPTMLDAHQIRYLLDEWLALYQHPTLELNAIPLTKTAVPTAVNKDSFSVHYAHLYGKLDHHTLTNIRNNSEHHRVSLPVVMLNLFSSELHKQDLNYPVNLSLINRFPFHPFMYDLGSFATSVASLPIEESMDGNFVVSCHNLDKELHNASIEVSETALDNFVHKQNQYALFSCTLEQNFYSGPLYAKRPDILYCNFDLPTPMIDYNVWEQAGQLIFRWT